jgi:MFS family permease
VTVSQLAPRRGPAPEKAGFGGRFVTAVSVGSVLNPINSSIIAIALVSVGHAFGVGADRTTWLVLGLYLATAVGQPTMGKLADRFGALRVYLAGMALVAAGGLIGFWGFSFGALIVSRVVIGLGTSAAFPAAMAMVHRQAARLNRPAPGSVLGMLALTGQVSMVLGPPLGGLLIAAGGWRWIFLVNLPLAVAGTVLALAWLPRDDALPRGGLRTLWRAVDPPGIALFIVGLIAVLVFLTGLPAPNWPVLAVGAVALAGLLAWELRAAAPFIDIRMLGRNRALTATYLRYILTFCVIYGFVYGWTQWLEESAGLSASASGLMLMPMSVVAAVVTVFGARGRRIAGPLLIGTPLLLLGSAGLLVLGHASGWPLLVGLSAVIGVPNGLLVVGNQAAMYAQAPGDQIGTASGLLRTFQYLGAIASGAVISLTYGPRATDAGLHHLAIVLTAACALLTVLTAATLRRPRRGAAA